MIPCCLTFKNEVKSDNLESIKNHNKTIKMYTSICSYHYFSFHKNSSIDKFLNEIVDKKVIFVAKFSLLLLS